MAGFKLHDPCCSCWYCILEDNWFHYLPISFKIYDRTMRWIRCSMYEIKWFIKLNWRKKG